jgi:hypothetical protein
VGVYELSRSSSIKTGRQIYTSMNAGNQFGAMVPIATVNGTGSSETVLIDNIPQTFQDLMLVASARAVSIVGNPTTSIAVNGNFSNIYSSTVLIGDGATASSTRNSAGAVIYLDNYTKAPSTTAPTSFVSHFLNYRAAVAKTVITRVASDRNGSGYSLVNAGLINLTSPITSMQVSTNWGGTFWTTDSTFTLYGIRAVSS